MAARVKLALEALEQSRGSALSALEQLRKRPRLRAAFSGDRDQRAYEKAGFVIEGRQRQHAWVRGAYADIVYMGILRSEQSLRPDPRSSGDARF